MADVVSHWPTWWPFAALVIWALGGLVLGNLLAAGAVLLLDWLDRRWPGRVLWWDMLADLIGGFILVISGPLCWLWAYVARRGGRLMLWLLPALVLLPLSSCSTATALRCSDSGPRVILKVDVSDRSARLIGEPKPVKVITGRAGIGGRPGSGCTPIGTFTVVGKYRNTSRGLGKSLHLAGRDENGREQYAREIMCHVAGWETERGEWKVREGTRGCIGLPPSRMLLLWDRARVGDVVEIAR